MDVLVVGASAAGLSCLDTLLKYAPGSRITVISEEKYHPYSRCLLTNYIGKELSENQLVIKEPSEYPPNIKFILGEKIETIDASKKHAVLSSGERLPYNKLLIAAGAHSLKPTFCKEERTAFTLRYLDDAKKIEKNLKDSATVVGGGFVGIKTAYGLMRRGIKVNLVISSPYPLAVILDETTGRLVESELKETGIKVATRTDIEEIKPTKDKLSVILNTGNELASDVIVVGKGVRPRTELAQNSGIQVNTGIKVNHFLETSAPDVYAAGDCCETFDVIRKAGNINAIWPVAVEQGYFAALNMLGFNAVYPGSLGMNSMKTDKFHLITAGTLKGGDLIFYEHYNPAKKQLRKIAFKGDVPVGMAFLNSPDDAGIFVNLIKKGEPVTVNPQKIADGEASMMDVMKL